jgi:hypothetical protein
VSDELVIPDDRLKHVKLRKKILQGLAGTTSGEWQCDGDDCDPEQNDPCIFVDIPKTDRGISVLFTADWGRTEDAKHIVACQPANIKALIEGYEQQLANARREAWMEAAEIADREADSEFKAAYRASAALRYGVVDCRQAGNETAEKIRDAIRALIAKEPK